VSEAKGVVMIRARASPHHRNNHHIEAHQPLTHFSDKPLNLLSCPSITETNYIITFPQASIIVSSINLSKSLSPKKTACDKTSQVKKEGFKKSIHGQQQITTHKTRPR